MSSGNEEEMESENRQKKSNDMCSNELKNENDVNREYAGFELPSNQTHSKKLTPFSYDKFSPNTENQVPLKPQTKLTSFMQFSCGRDTNGKSELKNNVTEEKINNVSGDKINGASGNKISADNFNQKALPFSKVLNDPLSNFQKSEKLNSDASYIKTFKTGELHIPDNHVNILTTDPEKIHPDFYTPDPSTFPLPGQYMPMPKIGLRDPSPEFSEIFPGARGDPMFPPGIGTDPIRPFLPPSQINTPIFQGNEPYNAPFPTNTKSFDPYGMYPDLDLNKTNHIKKDSLNLFKKNDDKVKKNFNKKFENNFK